MLNFWFFHYVLFADGVKSTAKCWDTQWLFTETGWQKGPGWGETLYKNRKEHIIWLLRKENSPVLIFTFDKKNLLKLFWKPAYSNFWCKTDQKLWKD